MKTLRLTVTRDLIAAGLDPSLVSLDFEDTIKRKWIYYLGPYLDA